MSHPTGPREAVPPPPGPTNPQIFDTVSQAWPANPAPRPHPPLPLPARPATPRRSTALYDGPYVPHGAAQQPQASAAITRIAAVPAGAVARPRSNAADGGRILLVAALALLPLLPGLIALVTELVAVGARCDRALPCAIAGIDAGILLRAALREAWNVLTVFAFGGLTVWLLPSFVVLHRRVADRTRRLGLAVALAAALAFGLAALPLAAAAIGGAGLCTLDSARGGNCPLWGVEMASVIHTNAMMLLAPLAAGAALLGIALYPLVGRITRALFGPAGQAGA